MPIRERLVVELIKEILGPRGGLLETLPLTHDPRSEYITGVLAPAEAEEAPDIDADAEEIGEEASGEEDESDAAPPPLTSVSPSLDPRSLPRSIGLSFTVEAEGTPVIEICATWARYLRDDAAGVFVRHPEHFLSGAVALDVPHDPVPAGPGVTLLVRTTVVAGGARRVSIFLLNSTVVPADGRAATEHHLFQPQIRVACGDGTQRVPVWIGRKAAGRTAVTPAAGQHPALSEEESLAMLFRKRQALARGHLCGAMWREIDPEQPCQGLQRPSAAPFIWTDSAIVSEPERRKFAPADVRTELVPCYAIEAPSMAWPPSTGPAPVLDPMALSETWDADALRAALMPVVDGYRDWIATQQTVAAAMTGAWRTIALANLSRCEEAALRIERAVQILCDEDEDARLAFCFANRAMALQASWRADNATLTWRPFQLAFILLNIPALADPASPDRQICDLLWFPTGGGKTEAYLGLAAFTMALRRRRSPDGRSGGGIAVISRYTLRLLTIQQFRRALGMVTACELMRVQGLANPQGPVGWRPRQYPDHSTMLWGGQRFSTGLWVGGGVTPNSLLSIGPIPGEDGYTFIAGALDILKGARRGYDGPDAALQRCCRVKHLPIEGEPAQITECPRCRAILAVAGEKPDDGLEAGTHRLHFICRGQVPAGPIAPQLFGTTGQSFTVNAAASAALSPGYFTLSLDIRIPDGSILNSSTLDTWWYATVPGALGGNVELRATRPSRPGYFATYYRQSNGQFRPCDFEIYCPDPACELNQLAWAESVPVHRGCTNAGAITASGVNGNTDHAALPAVSGLVWQDSHDWARRGGSGRVAGSMPIPAYTIDDQVYHRCPSLVIATVDKFARLAFEPKAASLFGNVTHYHARWGFYRQGVLPPFGQLPLRYLDHPPGYSRTGDLHVQVPAFSPPDMILQDELHLIEGPLGSMVGLYETAIERLCQRTVGRDVIRPKYVASTATVRQAGPQVQALFDRTLAQFPPSAVTADDRFFASEREPHPLDSAHPGRLYAGVCAPGKGAQTPLVRLWSVLLRVSYEAWQQHDPDADRFFTLVGYFNAIRELAGALSLFRQDIPERMAFQSPGTARPLERWMELSSRCSSLGLPRMLERLKATAPGAHDAVFATAMFGTGVDVDRLNLMLVHGQPKTTASYIQASGRVGRQSGGLVVTFLRASRPRDLDHYEFFTGYHRALHRHVESVTVAPFSPRARERALGPLSVILLRHARDLDGRAIDFQWRLQQRLSGAFFAGADHMSSRRHHLQVTQIPGLLEQRALQMPAGRCPPPGVTAIEAGAELDRWKSVADQNPGSDRLVYNEAAMLTAPTRAVVLGDSHHQARRLPVAYKNAPQSLRDIEETTGFRS